MKYDVIAYCWNDALAGFTQEDAQRLTHVNLAFGLLKDGLLDLHLLKYLHLLPRLREWNPEMKIVLSVGGWGADGFSDMAMTEEGRRNFAKSCLDAVEKYNLDGIDIDWEYPCNDAAGIGADPRDKENFTALLKTLREYLGEKRIVSVAVGASQRCIADTQMDKVAEIVDYVQLMTYDMVDGTRAGHHAALGATKGDKSGLNTRDTVEAYRRAGVPYEKIIIGAAVLQPEASLLVSLEQVVANFIVHLAVTGNSILVEAYFHHGLLSCAIEPVGMVGHGKPKIITAIGIVLRLHT